jgi:hypothetical protein
MVPALPLVPPIEAPAVFIPPEPGVPPLGSVPACPPSPLVPPVLVAPARPEAPDLPEVPAPAALPAVPPEPPDAPEELAGPHVPFSLQGALQLAAFNRAAAAPAKVQILQAVVLM